MTDFRGPAADALRSHATAERAWGSEEPQPEVWSSGLWTLERRGDELADIHYDGVVVLRSVRAVARDRDWDTVPTALGEVRQTPGGFEMDLRMAGLGADIEGTLSLSTSTVAAGNGAADELHIGFSGTSRTDFLRNRLGLVVLHPPTVAGVPLAVNSQDGRSTLTTFPREIAPHQPAMDIASLAWRAGGARVELRFEGDVFEMEDQRNWTDASFKTYSTPLSLPFPVLVTAGTRVEQSLTLRCAIDPLGRPPASAASPGDGVRLRLAPAGHAVPAIAVGASTAPGRRPPGLRAVGNALLVELEAGTSNWRAALRRAGEEADGRSLDVRVVAADAGEVELVLDAVAGLPLARLGVYSSETHVSEPDLWQALLQGASSRGLAAELVGGARSHFTELNRTHERLPGDLPALTFSITPQMHARERAQLVESIPMQRLVAENAVRIGGDRPVHVGPVTLRSRFNAVATSAPSPDGAEDVEHGYGAEHVPGAADARQASPALAAWTVASAAALAVPGVASITYFEEWGPRGLVDLGGEAFPVAAALEWLHGIAGRPALRAADPVPPGLWVLAAEVDGTVEVLLANLTADDIPGTVEAEDGDAATVSVPAFGTMRVVLARPSS